MIQVDRRLFSGAISLGFLISPVLAQEDAAAGGLAAVIVLIIFALLVNLRPRRMIMHRLRRMKELRGPEIRVASQALASKSVKKAKRKKRGKR